MYVVYAYMIKDVSFVSHHGEGGCTLELVYNNFIWIFIEIGVFVGAENVRTIIEIWNTKIKLMKLTPIVSIICKFEKVDQFKKKKYNWEKS